MGESSRRRYKGDHPLKLNLNYILLFLDTRGPHVVHATPRPPVDTRGQQGAQPGGHHAARAVLPPTHRYVKLVNSVNTLNIKHIITSNPIREC